MKLKYFIRSILMLSLSTMVFDKIVAQFTNTFSECLYVHDGNFANSDLSETLYGCSQDANGDYRMFGIGLNEMHLPINQSSHVLQYLSTDKSGVVINNQVFGLDEPNQKIIEHLEYREFDVDICGSQNWVLTTEIVNNESQVHAYLFDAGVQMMFDNIDVSSSGGTNHEHKMQDFIRNSQDEIVWVGSVHTYSGFYPTLGYSQDGCASWNTRLYASFSDVLFNGKEGVASSIVELNPSIMGAQYAVAGQMGINVFCMLLDANYDIVSTYLYDIDNSILSKEEAVKIKQAPSGNLVIVGNKLRQNGSVYIDDGIFILEIDQQMNLANSTRMLDLPDVCERVYDMEIDDLNNYIIVGQESTSCDQNATNGFAFMASVSPTSGGWIQRFHEDNTVDGSIFREVELVDDQTGTGLPQQFIATGSCWMGDLSSANNDFFVAKTDENGNFLDSESCQEMIGWDLLEIGTERYFKSPTIEEFPVDATRLPDLTQNLEEVSTFCDFNAECCEGTQQIFSQRYQATIEFTGCQEVTARLDEADDCWQVTWIWGDGTTDGPMPATLNPIVHQYQNGCMTNALIVCHVEELDGNGNTCFQRFGATSINMTNLITDGTFDQAWSNNRTLVAPTTSSLGQLVCPPQNNTMQYYSVVNGNDINVCNPAWCGISNNDMNDPYMICDPPDTAGTVLWEEAVTVDPSSEYIFCGDFKNLIEGTCCTNPTINVQVVGQNLVQNNVINAVDLPNNIPCTNWTNFTFRWNSFGSSTAIIRIVSNTTTRIGGDIGFDNLFFGECLSERNPVVIRSAKDHEYAQDTAIKEKRDQDVLVYPNPTSIRVNFEFDNAVQRKIEIFSLSGKQIETINSNEELVEVNVQSWKPGIYIARVKNEETMEVSNHKLMIH